MGSALSPLQVAVVPAISLVLVLAAGAPMIRLLRGAGAGQRVRDDGPQRHLEKEGTPTMGGALIVDAAAAAALAGEWWRTGGLSWGTVAVVAVMVAFACIGLADDWRKVTLGRSLGLRARDKLALQAVLGAAFVYTLSRLQGDAPGAQAVGWAAFWLLAMMATSNAMNLADGLDGLAAGLCVISAAGFAALGLVSGQAAVAVVALALFGACLGFLWFNRHPARVFMGDVGSLALGAAMAAMAAWLNQPWALVGLCLVPFIEEASVIAQVASFKTTGKRILRMSPIHHHFELSGWSEQRVVWTFWAVGLAAAAVTVAAATRWGAGAG